MKPKPYVGITGPTTQSEVEYISDQFLYHDFTTSSPHLPMIGFLVSTKTLNGVETQNRRYPRFSEVRDLISFCDRNIFTMIHYNSNHPDLSKEVKRVFSNLYDENLCRAIQLNIVFPDIHEVEKIKKDMSELKIVFQASKKVLESGNNFEVSRRIGEYKGLVDYVLIDPSGGRGVEFEINKTIDLYQKLIARLPDVSVGIAGGFNGKNVLDRVLDIQEKLGTSEFSIDAEGGLRDKLSDEYGDDLLNLDKVWDYIHNSSLAFF